MRGRCSGTLVGVASVSAIRGLPGHGAYCASKAGVVAYCESLRGECRPFGVKVVTLVPGYVATPLTAINSYAMPFLLSPIEASRSTLWRCAERQTSGRGGLRNAVFSFLVPGGTYRRVRVVQAFEQRVDEGEALAGLSAVAISRISYGLMILLPNICRWILLAPGWLDLESREILAGRACCRDEERSAV